MNEPSKTLYTAEAIVVGGRDGHARTSDVRLDIDLDVPAEMGGSGGPGINPEQLFAAGFAACFESALMSAARHKKKDIGTISITSRVGLGPIGGGSMGLSVEMRIRVPGVSRADAETLVRLADEICPYSNATRGNVPIQLIVEDPMSVCA